MLFFLVFALGLLCLASDLAVRIGEWQDARRREAFVWQHLRSHALSERYARDFTRRGGVINGTKQQIAEARRKYVQAKAEIVYTPEEDNAFKATLDQTLRNYANMGADEHSTRQALTEAHCRRAGKTLWARQLAKEREREQIYVGYSN